MATELPSLSKELDKHLTAQVFPGEVEDPKKNHYFATFLLDDREKANTPDMDLWNFHIRPALRQLAEKFNEFKSVHVRALPLPELKAPVIASFLSSDGQVPLRFTVTHNDDFHRYMFFIEAIVEGVS